jgi:transcriptional regulator with XRE-family HTH domain
MNEMDYIADYKRKIGENVRKYRKAQGLSQDYLARKAGITGQTLSCIETGVNNPSFNVLIKIIHTLNIPMAYIFTFDEEIYEIKDKELKYLVYDAFKDLDYKDRKIAFKLINCFKEEIN